jgi:hypothetical protein
MSKKGVDNGESAPVGADQNVRGPGAVQDASTPTKPGQQLAPDLDAKPVLERGTPAAGQGFSSDSKGTSGSSPKGSKKGG